VTVTAPFGATEDAAPRTQRIEQVDPPSLRRDPVLPFIVVGVVTLVAIIALGYLLTAPV